MNFAKFVQIIFPKMLFKYKATFKTWLRPGSPLVIQTRIVEAYDEDHVKILIQKQDYLIIKIEKQ